MRCSDGVVVGRVGVRLGDRGTLLSGPAQQHSLGRAGARLPGTLDPVPPVDPVPQPRHNRPERRRGPRVTVLANYKVLTTRKPPPRIFEVAPTEQRTPLLLLFACDL